MTDIVERLREMAGCGLQGWHDPAICGELRMAAAWIALLRAEVRAALDEIERLRAEVERLRAEHQVRDD